MGSLFATVLQLVVLVGALTGGPVLGASALSFPWSQNRSGSSPRLDRAPSSLLQEVAPPPAVRQLQEALADREPRVEILSPAADSLLAAGPWTLRLKVEDWPLVDAGPLGLGPHLVVQLDGDPPRRLTETEVPMPPLLPGSHRLTVYAARPWGEAVKSPGAFRQVRLHRAAANPLTLPAAGTPQLIAVGPMGRNGAEPLQLDWLLLDAPLQNLRAEDAGWRLRITINGDGFLIDRQTPLWLNGWRSGANTIQMELVDARGEPLNPPFNSLVSEVTLDPAAERPRWREGPLQPNDLARLLSLPLPEPERALEPALPEPRKQPELPNLPAPGLPDPPLSADSADVPAAPPTPGQVEAAAKAEAEAQAEAAEAVGAADHEAASRESIAPPERAGPGDHSDQEGGGGSPPAGEPLPMVSEPAEEPRPEVPLAVPPGNGDQETKSASTPSPGERTASAEAPTALGPAPEPLTSEDNLIRPGRWDSLSGFLAGLRERFGR